MKAKIKVAEFNWLKELTEKQKDLFFQYFHMFEFDKQIVLATTDSYIMRGVFIAESEGGFTSTRFAKAELFGNNVVPGKHRRAGTIEFDTNDFLANSPFTRYDTDILSRVMKDNNTYTEGPLNISLKTMKAALSFPNYVREVRIFHSRESVLTVKSKDGRLFSIAPSYGP